MSANDIVGTVIAVGLGVIVIYGTVMFIKNKGWRSNKKVNGK